MERSFAVARQNRYVFGPLSPAVAVPKRSKTVTTLAQYEQLSGLSVLFSIWSVTHCQMLSGSIMLQNAYSARVLHILAYSRIFCAQRVRLGNLKHFEKNSSTNIDWSMICVHPKMHPSKKKEIENFRKI